MNIFQRILKAWRKWEPFITDDPDKQYLLFRGFETGYQAAQQGVHLTAFGVGMLAFLAGFGICWLVFVR